MRSNGKKGAGLIEVVVGAAIMVFVVFGIVAAYLTYYRQGLNNVSRVQSTYLLEEGVEALRTMRSISWVANIVPLSTSTPYRLYYSTTTESWIATTSKSMIDGQFDRTFTLGSVRRDGSSNIVSTGGSVDVGTRLITVSVAWRAPSGTTTRTLSSYLMDIFNN